MLNSFRKDVPKSSRKRRRIRWGIKPKRRKSLTCSKRRSSRTRRRSHRIGRLMNLCMISPMPTQPKCKMKRASWNRRASEWMRMTIRMKCRRAGEQRVHKSVDASGTDFQTCKPIFSRTTSINRWRIIRIIGAPPAAASETRQPTCKTMPRKRCTSTITRELITRLSPSIRSSTTFYQRSKPSTTSRHSSSSSFRPSSALPSCLLRSLASTKHSHTKIASRCSLACTFRAWYCILGPSIRLGMASLWLNMWYITVMNLITRRVHSFLACSSLLSIFWRRWPTYWTHCRRRQSPVYCLSLLLSKFFFRCRIITPDLELISESKLPLPKIRSSLSRISTAWSAWHKQMIMRILYAISHTNQS